LRAGPIAVDEDFVGYAFDVGLVDRIDFAELAKQLSPVAEARLVLG
jgi:hypothetical protein